MLGWRLCVVFNFARIPVMQDGTGSSVQVRQSAASKPTLLVCNSQKKVLRIPRRNRRNIVHVCKVLWFNPIQNRLDRLYRVFDRLDF